MNLESRQFQNVPTYNIPEFSRMNEKIRYKLLEILIFD